MATTFIKVYAENGKIVIGYGPQKLEFASASNISYLVVDVIGVRSQDHVTIKAFGLPIIPPTPVDFFCYKDGTQIAEAVNLTILLAYFDYLGLGQNPTSDYVTESQLTSALAGYLPAAALDSYYTAQETIAAITTSLSSYYTESELDQKLANKVDVEPDARLITEQEILKLDSIQEGATAYTDAKAISATNKQSIANAILFG